MDFCLTHNSRMAKGGLRGGIWREVLAPRGSGDVGEVGVIHEVEGNYHEAR